MSVDLDVSQAGGETSTETREGRHDPAPAARIVLVAVPLYALIDTALLFLRPEFSILHNAESDYGSSGSWAWLMDLNFLLRGLLSLAAVRAVSLATPEIDKSGRFRAGQMLLVVWGVASALLAFFPDDPLGTPMRWHGEVHLVLAFIAFFAVAVGAIVMAHILRALPRWQSVRMPVAALPWTALVPLLLLGHAHFRQHSLGGLYEKVFLGIELLWLFFIALPLGTRSARQPKPRAAR